MSLISVSVMTEHHRRPRFVLFDKLDERRVVRVCVDDQKYVLQHLCAVR